MILMTARTTNNLSSLHLSNNPKLLSHNKLSSFDGKFTLYFFEKWNPNSHPVYKVGEDPAMINQNDLILLSFGGDTPLGIHGERI